MDKVSLRVFPATSLSPERLQKIETKLQALSIEVTAKDSFGAELIIDPDRMKLRHSDMDDRALVSVSFIDGVANHRRLYGGGRSQQLSKALGLDQRKNLFIVDTTAGLASDSFVMASLGARVQMLERSPVLSLMIDDALEVASFSEDEMLKEIISRMSIESIHSVEWMARQEDHSCDVIYLDPMFPERRKKAAVKKEMQLLQRLLKEESQPESERLKEEAKLLEIALQKAEFRVVVKRPRSAPILTGLPPTYALSGKSIRFDIYTRKKIG